MKKYVIPFIAIVLPLLVCCQGNIDIEQEEAAIKAVIEKERNTATGRGFDSWAEAIEVRESIFVHDSGVVHFCGSRHYEHNKTNFTWSAAFKDSLNNAPPPGPFDTKIEYTNFQIKVYPESAWAVYDQYTYSNEGELRRHFDMVRFLEKVDGEWKISYMNFINARSWEVDKPPRPPRVEEEETE